MNLRSPLKDDPLHNPGQSLQQYRDNLLYDKILTPLLFAATFVVIAGFEWWLYLSHTPRQPWIFSAIAVLAILFTIWKVFKHKPQFRQLHLAINGEKAVGQFLERLREDQYQVFHDVIGEGFNLDHVTIGSAGVFTIETKTYSKPHPDAKIIFDGETILVNGVKPHRDPVKQAKAQANWLKGILLESTGRKYDVWPVIVFPGWYVNRKPDSANRVWVLEPKELPGFLSNQPNVLAPEDVKLASFHLSRFIRTQKDDE